MKRLRIFAMIGVIGLFVAGGLATWGAFTSLNYVASKADQLIQSSEAQESFQSLKETVQGFSKDKALNCWNKAQGLLSVQPWLERPAVDNLANLKVACLDQRSSACEGGDCERVNNLTNTAEGGII